MTWFFEQAEAARLNDLEGKHHHIFGTNTIDRNERITMSIGSPKNLALMSESEWHSTVREHSSPISNLLLNCTSISDERRLSLRLSCTSLRTGHRTGLRTALHEFNNILPFQCARRGDCNRRTQAVVVVLFYLANVLATGSVLSENSQQRGLAILKLDAHDKILAKEIIRDTLVSAHQFTVRVWVGKEGPSGKICQGAIEAAVQTMISTLTPIEIKVVTTIYLGDPEALGASATAFAIAGKIVIIMNRERIDTIAPAILMMRM